MGRERLGDTLRGREAVPAAALPSRWAGSEGPWNTSSAPEGTGSPSRKGPAGSSPSPSPSPSPSLPAGPRPRGGAPERPPKSPRLCGRREAPGRPRRPLRTTHWIWRERIPTAVRPRTSRPGSSRNKKNLKSLNESDGGGGAGCRMRRRRTGSTAPSFPGNVRGEGATPGHVTCTRWARAGESFESLPVSACPAAPPALLHPPWPGLEKLSFYTQRHSSSRWILEKEKKNE